MKQHHHAVPGKIRIRFDLCKALFKGVPEGGHGIFRRIIYAAPMGTVLKLADFHSILSLRFPTCSRFIQKPAFPLLFPNNFLSIIVFFPLKCKPASLSNCHPAPAML